MSKHSSFVSIKIRHSLAAKIPNIVKIIPAIKLKVIAVCTHLCAFSISLFPIALAQMTFAPTETPINMLIIRFIKAPVEPTAANELSPEN